MRNSKQQAATDTVTEFLNSRNDYSNDTATIPIPLRLLRLVMRDNRALRTFVLNYLKNNDVPGLKRSSEPEVSFNHDAPYRKAEQERRLAEIEKAAAGIKQVTLEELRERELTKRAK